MKQTLILVLSLVFFAGCLGGSSNTRGSVEGPSKGEGKTFAEQYEELEKQPVPSREQMESMPKDNLQTAEDRAADVALEAQAERRGEPPLLESNYIFKVKQNKGVYSYDQHNQVWTDQRSAREYKETKRLWEKPKKYDASKYYGESSASSSEEYSYGED